MGLMPRASSPFRWIVFIIGIVVFLWGVLAIVVSGGLAPLSLVRIETPFGAVETNDRQFGGGLLLAFLGFAMVYVSSRL